MAEAPEKQGVTGEMRVGDSATRRNASAFAEALHEKFQREAAERYIESFQSPEGAMRAAASALGFNHLMKIFGPAARMGVGGIALAGVMGASDTIQRRKEERENTQSTAFRTLLAGLEEQAAQLRELIAGLEREYDKQAERVKDAEKKVVAARALIAARESGAYTDDVPLWLATVGLSSEEYFSMTPEELRERLDLPQLERDWSKERADLEEIDGRLARAREKEAQATKVAEAQNEIFGNAGEPQDVSQNAALKTLLDDIQRRDPAFSAPDLSAITDADMMRIMRTPEFKDLFRVSVGDQAVDFIEAEKIYRRFLREDPAFGPKEYEEKVGKMLETLSGGVKLEALADDTIPNDLKRRIIGSLNKEDREMGLENENISLETKQLIQETTMAPHALPAA